MLVPLLRPKRLMHSVVSVGFRTKGCGLISLVCTMGWPQLQASSRNSVPAILSRQTSSIQGSWHSHPRTSKIAGIPRQPPRWRALLDPPLGLGVIISQLDTGELAFLNELTFLKPNSNSKIPAKLADKWRFSCGVREVAETPALQWSWA